MSSKMLCPTIVLLLAAVQQPAVSAAGERAFPPWNATVEPQRHKATVSIHTDSPQSADTTASANTDSTITSRTSPEPQDIIACIESTEQPGHFDEHYLSQSLNFQVLLPSNQTLVKMGVRYYSGNLEGEITWGNVTLPGTNFSLGPPCSETGKESAAQNMPPAAVHPPSCSLNSGSDHDSGVCIHQVFCSMDDQSGAFGLVVTVTSLEQPPWTQTILVPVVLINLVLIRKRSVPVCYTITYRFDMGSRCSVEAVTSTPIYIPALGSTTSTVRGPTSPQPTDSSICNHKPSTLPAVLNASAPTASSISSELPISEGSSSSYTSTPQRSSAQPLPTTPATRTDTEPPTSSTVLVSALPSLSSDPAGTTSATQATTDAPITDIGTSYTSRKYPVLNSTETDTPSTTTNLPTSVSETAFQHGTSPVKTSTSDSRASVQPSLSSEPNPTSPSNEELPSVAVSSISVDQSSPQPSNSPAPSTPGDADALDPMTSPSDGSELVDTAPVTCLLGVEPSLPAPVRRAPGVTARNLNVLVTSPHDVNVSFEVDGPCCSGQWRMVRVRLALIKTYSTQADDCVQKTTVNSTTEVHGQYSAHMGGLCAGSLYSVQVVFAVNNTAGMDEVVIGNGTALTTILGSTMVSGSIVAIIAVICVIAALLIITVIFLYRLARSRKYTGDYPMDLEGVVTGDKLCLTKAEASSSRWPDDNSSSRLDSTPTSTERRIMDLTTTSL